MGSTLAQAGESPTPPDPDKPARAETGAGRTATDEAGGEEPDAPPPGAEFTADGPSKEGDTSPEAEAGDEPGDAAETEAEPESTAPARLDPIRRDFETPNEATGAAGDPTRDTWTTATGEALALTSIDEAHGQSLAVPVAFPTTAQAWRGMGPRGVFLTSHNRFAEKPAIVIEAIRFDVYLPADLPPATRVQARLMLKNKDGHWFDALGWRLTERDGSSRWERAEALHPGWNRIFVDLGEANPDIVPRGHRMRWSRYLLSQVSAFGVAFSGDRPYEGMVALDNMVAYPATDDPRAPLRLDLDPEPPVASSHAAPPRLTVLAAPRSVARYDLAEWSLTLNRPLLNPFHQGEVAIDAEITPPDGGEPIRVPAFYRQRFLRTKGSDAPGEDYRDRYEPVGPGFFCVRFTPRHEGAYRWRLVARYRSPVSGVEETTATDAAVLRVAPAKTANPRGFVRRSAGDHRAFEFENGEFFYPVGHSFRSPVDERHVEKILQRWHKDAPVPKDKGLRVYEEVLPLMAEHEINCFELWMASWWLGIEWTGKWKGYHGLGRYNLEHADKLDRVLELAARHGLYVHLVIDNHGKAAQALGRGKPQADHEFELSPYNVENPGDGGFLRLAVDLFRDERAKNYYRDKLRYIAARWGYSTQIYGIEMWSELDLIGHRLGRHREIYATHYVRGWHREMTNYLRSQNHGDHLITTHYSGDYRYIDQAMVKQDFIDYVTCDAYHQRGQPLIKLLDDTDRFARRFRKPYQITEFGGDWNASSREGLEGDLRGGLWFTWMTDAAGAPLFWWFEWLTLTDSYPVYQAFARYIDGEDKRRGPDDPPLRSDWKGDLLDGIEDLPIALCEPLPLAPDDVEASDPAAMAPMLGDDGVASGRGPSSGPVASDSAGADSRTATLAAKHRQGKVKHLQWRVLGDGAIFYAYLYDWRQLDALPLKEGERRAFSEVTLRLDGLERGVYEAEAWDCWTGRVVARYRLRADDQGRVWLAPPPFVVHQALKIRRVPDAPSPAPGAQAAAADFVADQDQRAAKRAAAEAKAEAERKRREREKREREKQERLERREAERRAQAAKEAAKEAAKAAKKAAEEASKKKTREATRRAEAATPPEAEGVKPAETPPATPPPSTPAKPKEQAPATDTTDATDAKDAADGAPAR